MDPKNPLHCGIELAEPGKIWGVPLPPDDWEEAASETEQKPSERPPDNDAEGSSLSRCIVDDEFPRMTVHSKRTRVPVIAHLSDSKRGRQGRPRLQMFSPLQASPLPPQSAR